MPQHAADLHVVHGALGAGVDRVVVANEVDRPAIDLGGAHDRAVGGAGHAGDRRPRQAAILDKAAGVGQSGDAFAGGPPAAATLLGDGLGPGLVELRRLGFLYRLQIRTHGRWELSYRWRD